MSKQIPKVIKVYPVHRCTAKVRNATAYYRRLVGRDDICNFGAHFSVDGVLLCERHAGQMVLRVMAEEPAKESVEPAEESDQREPVLGDVVTLERYRGRGEHEGWRVTSICQRDDRELIYNLSHYQGGATSALRNEIKVAT